MSSLGSALAGGAVSAIIFLLLSNGFKKVEAFTKGGSTTIFGDDANGKPFKVQLQNEAIIGPQYDIVELDTTTVTQKPARANYTIENPDDIDKRVFTIAFIPDSTFKAQGIIEIFLNGVRLFPITDPTQGFLSSVTALNIPIPPNFGLKIKPREKLEVFVYNPSGASAKVNFAVFVGNIA